MLMLNGLCGVVLVTTSVYVNPLTYWTFIAKVKFWIENPFKSCRTEIRQCDPVTVKEFRCHAAPSSTCSNAHIIRQWLTSD